MPLSLSNVLRERWAGVKGGKGGQERVSSLKELCCKYTAIPVVNSRPKEKDFFLTGLEDLVIHIHQLSSCVEEWGSVQTGKNFFPRVHVQIVYCA